MKIIFMGTPEYAEKILQRIIQNHDMEVVAVYTQPDKPVGRKKILTSPPVKLLAQKYGICVYQPNKLKEESVVKELLKIECDYIVVAAYGQILPDAILKHAPCINLHASILPAYRGASPIQQTLLNADAKTGVTAMLMDVGLDTGEIIKIDEIKIGEDEMSGSLFSRLTEVACDLTLDVLQNFKNYTPRKQDEQLSSCCTKITKQNGEIEFNDAFTIFNKYRAFTPWPGIYLKSGLKLKNMALNETESLNKAGEILYIGDDHVVVGCEKGSLKLLALQPESKNEMSALSYINGKRLKSADYLS